MSGRVPTPEQRAAIRAGGRDLLLEAGAGTGKTGVMVERYCRLVCDQGISPTAVLAFTFTDKAAAELRQRIRGELIRRAGEGSERARELLPELGSAGVTTIHGFCNRLLSGHPVAAGVDPRFRVLDEGEATRVAREAFDDALEEFLASEDEAREETVAVFGIDGLRAVVGSVHAELRSRGQAEPRLPEPPEPDVVAAVAQAASVAAETLEELRPSDRNRELLGRAATLGGAERLPTIDELAALRSDSSAKALAPYREAIDAALARVAEAGEGGEAYRNVAALLEIFSARFAAAKAKRAGIDFEDLQLIAASLLERAEIGEAYRARFSHLMVDEFQDTNRLQLRLVEALRGPRSELVVVGDELQAIYGFRHADLDVFREQRRRIEARGDAEIMELSGNFRSRPELVGAFNALGSALIGDSFHPLRVGALPERAAPGGGAPVELLLTAKDGWDSEGLDLDPAVDSRTPLNCLAEARFLAERLRELVDKGVERSEIVVLLRAFSHLDAYEDSLERAGLRPYVVGGRGYWSQQQVSDVCALLATIANPLDDQALFGALASPACAVAPDTLWLLRAASGRGRHVWPAIERAVGEGEAELSAPERLAQIDARDLELLRRFVATIAALRRRGTRLSLAGLVEAAVTETGYDLAVLMRPSGEARFANVRKLMRLAAEFEAREGRDLRGLLDFLGSRAEVDSEAQAASAAEGHDGVRVMTVHNAKGLEFGVVAVPDLARSLLAGSRPPLLALGREEDPRVGMQLRRLGAAAVNLYSYAELCEEAKQRDAEEGLRLFHVAATRARDRLILSGVTRPEPPREIKPATSVVERIVEGFGIDRATPSTVPIPPPAPRPGLDAEFEVSEIEVRINLPSPDRAAELSTTRAASNGGRPVGQGPAPLVERHPPAVPSRPLSYSAIAAFEACAYRFYLERVLDLGERVRPLSRIPQQTANAFDDGAEEGRLDPRDAGAAHGVAVHSLLEWSAANDWAEPPVELARRHAQSAGLSGETAEIEWLLASVGAWLGSELFRERIAPNSASVRSEAPLLLRAGGSVLRGSIDLLVERPAAAPLVVDYKTDRLGEGSPAERASRYETQRDIYALAVAEARDVEEVEVAYVFLERPDEPVLAGFDGAQLKAARDRLTAKVAQIESGTFLVAAVERRDWPLCAGCPALGRLCSGPQAD